MVTSSDIALMAATLANGGINPKTKNKIVLVLYIVGEGKEESYKKKSCKNESEQRLGVSIFLQTISQKHLHQNMKESLPPG